MSEFLYIDENRDCYNYSNDFDIFWEAYPRKVGKMNALKSWKRLKPSLTLRDMIMMALEFHKKQEGWNKDNGKFIPHPATWLNQHRWDDEIKLDPSQRKISEAEKARIAERMAIRSEELYKLAERDLMRRRAGAI